MRVFKINDMEWWIGHSISDIAKVASEEYGLSREEVLCDPRELTNRELDILQYWDCEDHDVQNPEHWVCECGYKGDSSCRWNGSVFEHHHGYPIGHVAMNNINKRTFREQFEIVMKGNPMKPEVFAITEY